MNETPVSNCARCGAPFRCGIDDPGGCWCAKLPPAPREALDDSAGCLCAACLRKVLDAAPACRQPSSAARSSR